MLSVTLKCRGLTKHTVCSTLASDRNGEHSNKYFVASKKYRWGTESFPSNLENSRI